MSATGAGGPPVSAQAVRERAVSRMTAAQQSQRSRDSWNGEEAAIYCRVSHIKDKDQTSVERQERICRGVAGDFGLHLASGGVFIDPNRSAWQRNRKRPGWDALLELARSGGIRHIVVYHPDRLMRQPWDLEELLKIADEHGIILHGKSGNRDLSDPDDRHYLRGEVAHACRSSDDTSRRLKDAMVRGTYPHDSGKARPVVRTTATRRGDVPPVTAPLRSARTAEAVTALPAARRARSATTPMQGTTRAAPAQMMTAALTPAMVATTPVPVTFPPATPAVRAAPATVPVTAAPSKAPEKYFDVIRELKGHDAASSGEPGSGVHEIRPSWRHSAVQPSPVRS